MCTLFVTDYTSSLTVKCFLTKSDFEKIKDHICEGNTLKIREKYNMTVMPGILSLSQKTSSRSEREDR